LPHSIFGTTISLLSKTYPHYYVSRPVYGGTTALFSKLPLTNTQELEFNIDRPAIIADVEYTSKVVTIASAHLNPSFWAYNNQPLLDIPGNFHDYIKDQNTQARMIIEAVKSRTNSTASFLACDCNSQETASTNRLLRTYFEDSFRSIGFQTGETNQPTLKFERDLSHIDYVWFQGNAEVGGVYRSIETAGSDHAAVVADFILND